MFHLEIGGTLQEFLDHTLMESMKEVPELVTDILSKVWTELVQIKEITLSSTCYTGWLETAESFLSRNHISHEILSILAVALLVAVMFIWCVSNGGRQFQKKEPDSPSPKEVISIFELAKTAYKPGHSKLVKKLVSKLHFDVNFPIPTNGMTLFLCACISGQEELVKFLLDEDADVSLRNSNGDTCLYLATFACAGSLRNNLSILELLISAGCDVNAQNKTGNTPLHWAASKGDVPLIKFLLQHGADPNIRNNIGVYPIGMATNAGFLRAGKLLKISLPDPSTPWDMFEPHTPIQARLGLLRPRRDHLCLSPRPRMRLDLSHKRNQLSPFS